MKKEVKLTRKIDCLLKKLNCPRFLHHFGPKKYKFKQHAAALLLKEVCKMSFRRVSNILSMLGLAVPSFSALCKMRKRIPHWVWEQMLKISSGIRYEQVAIDGTGFSRTNPSYHYIKRINRRKPVKSYTKLSALFDTQSKKFCAIRIRTKPRHDIKDAKYLLKRVDVQTTLFGDTAYDAEWLHEYCFNNNIQTQIKPRKNVRRGFYRRKQMKNYSEEKYHQRSLIESGFGSLKRKYGGSVSGKSIVSVRPEIYCKVIAHNLGLSH
jgi:transposase